MMNRRRGVPCRWGIFLVWAGWVLVSQAADTVAEWNTDQCRLGLNGQGSLAFITSVADGQNYLAPGQPSPLLSLRIGEQWRAPETATWNAGEKKLVLGFGASGAVAVLRAEAAATHVRFELADLRSRERVELVLWGPYPTTISNIIGETIGVVRNDAVAIGIQSLNPKTLGGFPSRDDDIENDYGANDQGHYANLPAELCMDQGYRGDTARVTKFGSTLQAYCRNRDRERIIANWGHDRYWVPPFADGGVVGSKIALFACPAVQALATLGAIEVRESLPHPILDGVWAKASPLANCSYLIVDFGEATMDRAIEMTKRAGLKYLYHSSPFETWGHFRLKPDLFPHGWDGLRTCVEKARQAGVRIGFHTLSNFITPNDPYVTPKPDPRLAKIGKSNLTLPVDSAQKEIAVAAPDFFRKNTTMNTVVIGSELIRYGKLSAEAPWRLLDCQRGAWGTKAAEHAQGEEVGKLLDHEYRVFLTDADLTLEVARTLAALCNHTGTLQLSLDGLEGAWSTGMGQYGRTLFTTTWYGALQSELSGSINDASNPGHFNWHVYTRMNWGEPWYAGFRESQTLYRFKNQVYFERNLMPHMLGWFALRPDTSVEDAEWLLARAAGFEAGFTLAASLASTAQLTADPASADAARQFGATPAILEAIRQWETARMSGAFPAEVRERLRDNQREFHLEKAGELVWDLSELHVERVAHESGRAEVTESVFTNVFAAQPIRWILRAMGKQSVAGVVLEVNGRVVLDARQRVWPAGGVVRCQDGTTAVLYDAAWKELERWTVNAGAAQVGPGKQVVRLRAPIQEGAAWKLELATQSPPLRLRSPGR